MACPKSATQSLLKIVTSLSGPIWKKWNGSAVPYAQCFWLQTTLVFAWLWLMAEMGTIPLRSCQHNTIITTFSYLYHLFKLL
jgi:hypothetical protein